MFRPTMGVFAGTILTLIASVTFAQESPRSDPIDFSRDIRPLLSDACFACHGPAEAARESELRLDTRAGAFVDLGDYQAIVPGMPEESSLYQRLVSEDEDEVMPPLGSDKRLTPEQIELIRKWIEQGADYQEHWAFETPVKAPLPELTRDPGSLEGPTVVDWSRNEIDHFILARLQHEGLTPNRSAPRETLIRRVTFDLTGLPPTLAEVDAYVNDTESGAYERLVNRLLESKQYGEHMTRFWLDAARYGDTHGLHLDNYREMWPYRDWVINAFNSNMPFDQFTIEQLAGDLLPEATLAQQIATGFNRCHVTTNEGGTIAEEFYVRNVIDRVDTTGQVFMGITLGCAVCHEHKYDPISHTEYYQMFAFFNNLDGSAMDGNVKDHAPFVYVPTAEQLDKQSAIAAERVAIEGKHAKRSSEVQDAFSAWLTWQKTLLDSGNRVVVQAIQPEGLTIHLPLDETTGDKVANQQDAKKPASVKGTPKRIDAYQGGGIEFTADSYVDLGKLGVFGKGSKFSFGAWIRAPGDVTGAAISKMDQARNTGYELQVANRRVRVIFARSEPDLSMSIETDEDALEPNVWHHLFVTYDGSARATGMTLYVDGKRAEVEIKSDQLGSYDFKTGKPLLLGRRDQKSPFLGGAIDEFRVYDRLLTESEVAQIALTRQVTALLSEEGDTWSDIQREKLLTFYLTQYDSTSQDQSEAIQDLRDDEAALRKKMTTTLVFREQRDIRPAYLLDRGEYDQQTDKTERITPAIFPPMKEDLPRNRLGLAKWLVSDDHPLTSRVTVNRFWQQLFGTGIVKTAEDFGSQGEPPSHPELLDWLAVDFREGGWDVKQLMKKMLMSATYRQSSAFNGSAATRDPGNRLLARGPRFRLDAEMLRDQALSVSGLLVQKVGGASVKPPQPDGLWFAVGYSGSNTVRFKADEGDQKVHRRTLYTFIKRTAPPPQMSIFDAPSREACLLRRERTNTPLQALLMLNDPQYFEAACKLAERVLNDGGDTDRSRVIHMLRLCTADTPGDLVIDELLALLRDESKNYKDDAKSAEKMLAAYTAPSDEKIDVVQLAAWTMLANVVLNLDEVVCKN